MLSSEREIFLAERSQGIGGSDIGSLLSNKIPVEYGCERNLWARLSGIPTDNPDVETEPMALGNLLEPFIATAYSDITGRAVAEAPLKKHATESTLQVHVDRIIHPGPLDEHKTDGVLEIKAVGREMMRKIQDDGLPIDYVLQLNHGMFCHDLTWGAFAIGMREDLLPMVALMLAAQLAGEPAPAFPRRARIEYFDVPRDEEICYAIREHGPKFWATLGKEDQAPPRLEPEDPRCGRCPRRIWCQGALVMEGVEPGGDALHRPDLGPLGEEHRANVARLEQCEHEVKATEDKFKVAMDGYSSALVPITEAGTTDWRKITWKARKGAERIDGRAMAPIYDALRKQAIAAGIPGAELAPLSREFTRKGMPSRPLKLSQLLPKKPKKKGEIPETDEE